MIIYTDRLSNVRTEQLEGFFDGWPNHPDPESHLTILRGSHAVWLAFDGPKCVGFINALSDGVFYASIPLLEVLPAYQGKGIGKELLRRMSETLKRMYAIDLVCDEPLAAFYGKNGFSRGVGMMMRRYENQGARNTFKES